MRPSEYIHIDESLTQFSQFLEGHEYSQIIVLTDVNCDEHCFPVLLDHIPENSNMEVLTITAGESSKSLEACEAIWQNLLDLEVDRNALMINLGGGMITDLGGLIATTWKRGIDFIHVPTSLLGMVDASIGGKTGINFNGVKNIIGSFTEPKRVFISKTFLNTLPEREYISGFAEVLKYGLVTNADLWNKLKELKHTDVDDYLEETTRVKIGIVEEDHFEEGRRKILNFGHTIGHGIESYCLSQDCEVLHGEAVAAGMICESYMSMKLNDLTEEEYKEIKETIQGHFEKIPLETEDIEPILEYMRNDKKNDSDEFQFSLINEIGSCDIHQPASVEDIQEALQNYIDD